MRTRKSKRTLNIFAGGGDINDMISSGLNILQTGMNNAKTTDTNSLENQIEQAPSIQSKAKTNDELLKDWSNNYNPLEHVSYNQIRGGSTGSRVMSTLDAAVQGAETGMTVGGLWGATAGAVVGLGSGIAGSIFGNKKAAKQRDDINKKIDEVNQRNLLNLNNKAQAIQAQNALKMQASYFGEGGNLYEDIPDNQQHGGNFTNGITFINNGGTHEENPLTGIPMGIAPNGKPNLVEQGEVKYDNYIFSNRIKPDEEVLNKLNLSFSGSTFANMAKSISKESKERPNDPISKKGLEDSMAKLQMAQEIQKAVEDTIKNQKNQKKYGGNLFYGGGELEDIKYTIPEQTEDTPSYNLDDSWLNDHSKDLRGYYDPSETQSIKLLSDVKNNRFTEGYIQPKNNTLLGKLKNLNSTDLRYAPVVGSAINVFTDMLGMTNKPNTDAANMMDSLIKDQPDIQAKPIGNYLTYNPLDRDYYTNKLSAQNAATRAAIINNSGGNRANAQANILAADYNYNQGLGNLARQSEEYNLAQRERVEGFNRGANEFNSQQALQAAGLNLQKNQTKEKALMTKAQLIDEAYNRASASKSANLTNLFQNLGNVGKEQFSRNMIASNPALYYTVDNSGNIKYKNVDKLAESLGVDEKTAKQIIDKHASDNK